MNEILKYSKLKHYNEPCYLLVKKFQNKIGHDSWVTLLDARKTHVQYFFVPENIYKNKYSSYKEIYMDEKISNATIHE